jgi:hypothetical protein
LCRDFLGKIAAKEALFENNAALTSSIAALRNFGAKAEGQGSPMFEKFRKALDVSLARLVNEA